MRTRIPMLIGVIGLVACLTREPAAASGADPSPLPAPARSTELSPSLAKATRNQIAALEPVFLAPDLEYPTIGLLPGWREKVCPQFSGLTRQQGEFAPFRASFGHCARRRSPGGGSRLHTHIHIYVTDWPRDLPKSMQRSDAIGVFGYRGRPYLVDQFIDTPHPVRVWYNIVEGPPVTFRFAFIGVVVVADRGQLQHVSLGQLADYLGWSASQRSSLTRTWRVTRPF